MTREELLELIAERQAHCCELADVEVKSANKGTPGRLYEALSAFANRTGGGVILFGLDEGAEFKTVGVADAQKLQEHIVNLATSEMAPTLRPDITVEQVEGKVVVAVEIVEVPAGQKPCYYKPAGLQKGSYIRVGNTNRQMNDYEIFGYVSSHSQPTCDEEAILKATLEDLDREKLQEYVHGLRRARPDAQYLNYPNDKILNRLKVAAQSDNILRPTLAGLLMFGKYPQEFEPQLVTTFLQYYGTVETEPGPRGERFLDNRKFEGPIPQMLENAVNHVLTRIRTSSLIDGLWRRDIPEYPEVAVREALANALAHRDYSNYVRGSYVQIRLFADRLEIQSPGGLYGNVSEDTIETEHSTRNSTLMRLMEDLRVVENRGTGVRTMIEAMRKANLEPPRFKDNRVSFLVTFHSHTLLSPDIINWLNQFARLRLNDHQRVALAYLRRHERITNSDYQRLNYVDTIIANKELRGLLQAGLTDQQGTKRWAYYTLKPYLSPEQPPAAPVLSDEDKVLEYVRNHGGINNTQCRNLLGIKDIQRASRLLKKMRRTGLLWQVGQRRGARYILPSGHVIE